jgi:hypothetical protein
MDTHNDKGLERDDAPVVANDVSQTKQEWHEPKLMFVEPALTDHGPLTSVTGQFFGAFSPPEA